MPERDPYDVLGVRRDATPADIRAAWRRRVLQHHPDRGGDPEKFREALAAFELLSDPGRRAAVDDGRLTLEAMLQVLDELGPDVVQTLGLLRSIAVGVWRGRFLEAVCLCVDFHTTSAGLYHRISQLLSSAKS